MQKCLICGYDTQGSVGKAGIFWKQICQPCKDKEDEDLLRRITQMNYDINWALNSVKRAMEL